MNWQSRSLEECIERVRYEAKIPRSQFLEAGPYPIVSQEADFISGFWDKSADLFKAGCPVVVFGDHTRVLKYVDFEFVIGADGVKILKPKPFLDPKYFYYFLRSVRLKRLGYARHYRLLAKVSVSYPSLPEQRRIAAILDEAFEGIDAAVANAEKNLANARELFDNYLHSVFSQRNKGWKEKTVGELADYSLGKMLDKQKNRGALKQYLRNLNVRWFGFDLSDLLEMPFEEKEHERYTAIKGDVLICEGGYPGRAAIWEDESPIYFQKAIHRVRFKENFYNKWFLYFLYISDARDNLCQHFTGSGIQHLTGQSLHKITLPVPPAQTASKLIERFDYLFEQTKNLERIYRQKLIGLTELKHAILQKAFAGELSAQPEESTQKAAE